MGSAEIAVGSESVSDRAGIYKAFGPKVLNNGRQVFLMSQALPQNALQLC